MIDVTEWKNITFTGHAVRRMFARGISKTDVVSVITSGKVIAEYPGDKPFPSCLVLGLAGGRSLHVVVALEEERQTRHIVTVYEPTTDLWEADYQTRKPK